MINIKDYTQYAVVSDFDGTISIQDSNDMLFKILGNEENERIETLYKMGRIGTRDGFTEHFKTLAINEDEYNRFILEYIDIDKDFKHFYGKIKEMEIPFFVVSGGFSNAISLLLRKEGIACPEVYANTLVMKGNRLSVKFAIDREKCQKGFGVCGNCKVKHLERIRGMGKKIIFIGDGLTDKCAAHNSDIVFAKHALAEYCAGKGIKYIPYGSFKDVYHWMFGQKKGTCPEGIHEIFC